MCASAVFSPMLSKVVLTTRSWSMVPFSIMATGVEPGKPPASKAVAMAAALRTPIMTDSVAPDWARAVQSTKLFS